MNFKQARSIVHRFQTGDVYFSSYSEQEIKDAYTLLGEVPPTTRALASGDRELLPKSMEGLYYILAEGTHMRFRERTRHVGNNPYREATYNADALEKLNAIIDGANELDVNPLTIGTSQTPEQIITSYGHLYEVLPFSTSLTESPRIQAREATDRLAFIVKSTDSEIRGGITFNTDLDRFEVLTSHNASRSVALRAADPGGGLLTYRVVSNPTHGTLNRTEWVGMASGVTLQPPLIYRAKLGYAGVDDFVMAVENSAGVVVNTTVRMKVAEATPLAVNTRVRAYDMGTYTMPEDAKEVLVRLSGFVPGNHPLSYEILKPPTNGTLLRDEHGKPAINIASSNNNPTVAYTPKLWC